MAKQTLTGGNGVSGQTGQEVIDMLNAMFTELYNQAHARAHSITSKSDHSKPPEESWGLFLKANKTTGVLEFSAITAGDLPAGGGGGGAVIPTELKYGQYIELLDSGLLTRRDRVTIRSSNVVINEGIFTFMFDENDAIDLGLTPIAYTVSLEAVIEWADAIVQVNAKYHIGWEGSGYNISELENVLTTNYTGERPVFVLSITGIGLSAILTTDGASPIMSANGEIKLTIWGHTYTIFQQT